jgi:hypothetical protein
VPAGEKAHNDAVDNFTVPDDDLGDFLFYPFELFLKRDNLLIDGAAHLNVNAPTSRARDESLQNNS